MSQEADFTVRLIDKVTGGARGATRSINVLEGALRGGAKATGVANRGAKEFDGTLHRLARNDSAPGALTRIGEFVAGGLIQRGISSLVELGTHAAHAAYELVTFGQSSLFAFDQLAKHGATGAELFDHARALAVRFGLDIENTSHAYANFLKLQFSPKEADKMIRMGADLQALGSTAEEVQGIFLALGQIKGKGRLQSQEMLQLAERGVSQELVQEEIGKRMGGKSTAEVQKLQQAGKVSADVGLEAIQAAVMRKLQEKELGQAGARFADQTIQGMWGRFKSLSTDSGLDIVGKLTDPLTKMAGGALDKFEGFLVSPQGAQTMNAIANSIGRGAEMAVKLADGFLSFTGVFSGGFGEGFGQTFGVLWDGAKPLFASLAGGDGKTATAVISMMARHLGQVAGVALAVIGGVGAAAVAFGVLGHTAIEAGIGILAGLTEPFAKMIAGAVMLWDDITAIWDAKGMGLVTKAFDIGGHIIRGLGNGIWALVTYPIDAAKGVAGGVIDALKNTFGIRSPSRVGRGIGENVGSSVGRGTASQIGFASSQATALGRAHSDALAASMASGQWASDPSSFRTDARGVGFAPSQGASRSVTFSPTVHVNVSAGSDAQDTGESVAVAVRREFNLFFRQMAAEA